MGASTLDPERTRAFLFQAARRVHASVRREWRADPGRLGDEAGMGADGTPTKVIDKIAEDVILETLAAADINLNVLSEERGLIDNGAEHTLVVDPIDGTRNAVHNIPFYCVSMAIGTERCGDIEYALIRNLTSDDTYYARKDHGLTLNGEPCRVRPLDMKELMVACLYDDEDDLHKLWAKPHLHLRDMGSCALEMALVGSGGFDAFVSHIDFLRVIDIAAGALIVREAGGEVYTADGKPLDTPFTLKQRTSVVAVSHPDLLEVLI